MDTTLMILAILQARVSSSRLPGKVLKPILGKPMLFLQIERLMRCRRFHLLVVATSIDRSDDILAQQCAERGILVYRGSLTDVLDRFIGAAQKYEPDAVVRLTGDCPLADWEVIDLTISTFLNGGYDYLSNTDPPTYPDGLDVEIVSYRALIEAGAEARLPSEREHVTLFARNHPDRYRIGSVKQQVDLSSLRWTVDESEDLEFVRAVYEALYPSKHDFNTSDILALIGRRPELRRINDNIARDVGLSKSRAIDEEWQRQQRN
jgi:spore coat polysaccharide biosynthesis protein SpsF (cytidylyltransferase family)